MVGEIPDSFFEVTVDDIRVMLRDLKNERYLKNLIFWHIGCSRGPPDYLKYSTTQFFANMRLDKKAKKAFDDFMLETR